MLELVFRLCRCARARQPTNDERTNERASLRYNDRWRFRVCTGFIVDLNNTRSVENNAGLGKRRFNGPRITILIARIRYSAERMDFKSIRAASSRQLIDSSSSRDHSTRQPLLHRFNVGFRYVPVLSVKLLKFSRIFA